MCSEKDRCKKCDAEKVVRDRKVLEVHVDKGMKDGHKFHFRGESNQVLCAVYVYGCTSGGDIGVCVCVSQIPGREAGDIIIVLDEKEHDFYTRKGADLKIKMVSS